MEFDMNYGGTLMMWDSVFGTFQREIGPIDYGVTTGHYSYNPFWIMLGPKICFRCRIGSFQLPSCRRISRRCRRGR